MPSLTVQIIVMYIPYCLHSTFVSSEEAFRLEERCGILPILHPTYPKTDVTYKHTEVLLTEDKLVKGLSWFA